MSENKDWKTGAKFDQGKPQIGLISKIFVFGLARVLTFGAKKYAAHNWRKGIAYSRLFDALQRHLWAWWAGEEFDAESGESHLDHAACCLMFLRELSETSPGLDDRWCLVEKQKTNVKLEAVGKWMSAALDDPKVCPEMKEDINAYLEGLGEAGLVAGVFEDWKAKHQK